MAANANLSTRQTLSLYSILRSYVWKSCNNGWQKLLRFTAVVNVSEGMALLPAATRGADSCDDNLEYSRQGSSEGSAFVEQLASYFERRALPRTTSEHPSELSEVRD